MESRPDISIRTNPDVLRRYNGYPEPYRSKLIKVRELIIETANELEIPHMEETLKWGEPSYLVHKGSTIRLAWKPNNPDQCAIYFKCTSKLVPTFRDLYPKKFSFEGNRAIVFSAKEVLSVTELKKLIAAALQYHKVKELPNLGIQIS